MTISWYDTERFRLLYFCLLHQTKRRLFLRKDSIEKRIKVNHEYSVSNLTLWSSIMSRWRTDTRSGLSFRTHQNILLKWVLVHSIMHNHHMRWSTSETASYSLRDTCRLSLIWSQISGSSVKHFRRCFLSLWWFIEALFVHLKKAKKSILTSSQNGGTEKSPHKQHV